MKKYFIIVSLMLLLLAAVGCTRGQEVNKEPWMLNMQSGMGGVNNKPDVQEYHYEISLSHNEKSALEDVKVELQLNDLFKGRILLKEGPMHVDAPTVQPGDDLSLEGKIVFNTLNLSKKDIIDMGSVIEKI